MFRSSFVLLLAALAAAPTAIRAITVTGPSSDKWWVFGSANQITWTTNNNTNEPTPVSFTITNPDSDTLNGVFSISEFVAVDQKQYTVTDVTIKAGTGYVVNLVNPKNTTEIYASSSPFEVKPSGSAPYGATVYTVLSLSVQNGVTETFTLVQTSYALSATPTPALTGSAGSSVASVSSTSSVAAAATATLRRPDSSNGAATLKGAGTLAMGLVGAVAGLALII